jgi:hypothetical protein
MKPSQIETVFLFLNMQSFFDQFVKSFLKDYNNKGLNSLLILPSKRAVSALKSTFAKQDKTIWLPEIVDIVSFIEKLSGLDIIDKQEALIKLYKVNDSVQNRGETFESFYGWGSTLLSDFNEIDRFLVDINPFFEHHKALKELYYFGEKKTDLIKSYIAFWERLPLIYKQFRKQLLDKKQAYQGLAYRIASENCKKNTSDQNIIFLGFNALNKAEEVIFEHYLNQGNAKIAWDIDSKYIEEKHHPANKFITKYMLEWNNYKNRFIHINSPECSDQSITIIPTPKNIGQAKAVADILNDFNEEDIQSTAIVLNDENLLNPVLNSIPKHIKEVNITMGVPLAQSSHAVFFDNLFTFQKEGKKEIKYNFLKSLLNYDILDVIKDNEKHQILSFFQSNRVHSMTLLELKKNSFSNIFIEKLIECLTIAESPVIFISSVLDLINEAHQLHRESPFLLGYQFLFSELKDILQEEKKLSITAALLLFRDMQKDQKLSFKGSKTSGLQVMGMLETRLLDFRNIIMTSVNEGILPSGKSDNSYITYSLKKDYGLPTHTEKDAIYAYHFFRLLQRTKKCFLIYDNDQTGFNKGDKSRFITYLEVFRPSHIQLKSEPFLLDTRLDKRSPVKVEKTAEVMNQLKILARDGFSPTALSTYISNPLNFYKKYVLNVKEAIEISEVIDLRDYGTIIHNTLEDLYTGVSFLKLKDVEDFENKYIDQLNTRFNEVYAESEHQKGQNRIHYEIAKSSIGRFLELERKFLKTRKVEIIGLEKYLETIIQISGFEVKLKGKIDRIDKQGDLLRIIDLKTGSVSTSDLKFEDFEEIITDEEKAKVFQTMFYAYLFYKEYNITELQSGIISFKNLSSWFMPIKHHKKNKIDENFIKAFEEKLFELINEILDQDIPFIEKESIFES